MNKSRIPISLYFIAISFLLYDMIKTNIFILHMSGSIEYFGPSLFIIFLPIITGLIIEFSIFKGK